MKKSLATSYNAYISFFPHDFAIIIAYEYKPGFTRRKIMCFVTTNHKSYWSITDVWITNHSSYYQLHPYSISRSVSLFLKRVYLLLSKLQIYQWLVFEASLFHKYEIRVKRYSMIIMRISVLMSISLAVGNHGATGMKMTLKTC